MSELKKCPFCGKAIEKLYKNTFGEISLVGCMNLDCPFCRTLFTPKQWNTRPLEDAMQAKLDIAVEAFGEIYESYRDSDKSAEYAADVHAIAEVALAEIEKVKNE